MTSAGFEALHQLAGAAERLGRVFGAAGSADSVTYEGHDGSETVHAVVDAAGTVVDVRLDHDWYERIDARMLGAAVVEAVSAAGVARLSGWAERVADAQREEPAAVPAPPPPVPTGPIELNPSRELIDRLLYLLHRVGTEAEAEARAAAATAGSRRRPVRGRSEGGHVTVALDGQQVVEVQIETDTRWIGTANNLEVASELRDAFTAAYAAVAEATPRRRSDSAIDELRSLTADPERFVAELFGTAPSGTRR